MKSIGVDQSSRPPPSADALAEAGVRLMKCLRPAEVRAYDHAGIQAIASWETSEGRSR